MRGRGRPLNQISPAEFESIERRVEDRALSRYLDRYDEDGGRVYLDSDEPPSGEDR